MLMWRYHMHGRKMATAIGLFLFYLQPVTSSAHQYDSKQQDGSILSISIFGRKNQGIGCSALYMSFYHMRHCRWL